MVEQGEVEEVIISSDKITITPKQNEENTSIWGNVKTTYYTGYIDDPSLGGLYKEIDNELGNFDFNNESY